jgi:FkbM family methyltransferase
MWTQVARGSKKITNFESQEHQSILDAVSQFYNTTIEVIIMSVSRDEVVWCYRIALGREPESDEVIRLHMDCENLQALRRSLLTSPEFVATTFPLPDHTTIKIDSDDNTINDPARLFRLLYGRAPNAVELNTSNILLAASVNDPADAIRSMVAGFDHHFYTTPFTVRHSVSNIEYISIHGFELAIDKFDTSVAYNLRDVTYEAWLIDFYKGIIKPGNTFVDIGANIGTYSMLAATLVGKNGKVLSFEPNSENCRLLLLSALINNFDNIQLFPFALTNEVGCTLFINAIGSNGAIVTNDKDKLVDSSCFIVPTNRLDNIITDNIDFIKMDVEGAEGLVLNGALGSLAKYKPLVTSEFSLEMLSRVSNMHGKEYLLLIKSIGYDLNMIDRSSGGLIDINDVEKFIGNYGEITRIEDLVFIPK